MSFDPTYVLVDGTFRSPAVLVAFAISTLIAVTCGWLLVRAWWIKRSPSRWGPYTTVVVFSPLFLLLSPLCMKFLINIVSGAGPWRQIYLCLMPTNYLVRDWGPGVIGLSSAVLYAWRRERAVRAA